MTSTYTTNKSIEKPGNGDYVNTWSTPVNNDWDIIDRSLGGTTLINAVGASGTVTLTATQYQSPSIIISGTLTANVNYQVPSGVGGNWTIYNNTSGSFTITISSAGGGTSGIIPQGYRALLNSDGTNISAAVTTSGNFLASAIRLAGSTSGYTGLSSAAVGTGVTYTLPSADGTSGQVLATNGSAVLSWQSTSGVVSFSGGTTGLTPSTATAGAIVLAGTLLPANGGTGITALGTGVATALGINVGSAGSFVVNGGALGTPSSGVVTNLTGTASININGTVGATTAASGSFTSLAYSTTLTGGTGVVNLGSGQFYKDASGNVGIGVTPIARLDVAGAGSRVRTDVSGATPLVSVSNPGAGAYATYAMDTLSYDFRTNGSTKVVVDTNGNVGIGTSTPVGRLDIRGGDITVSRTAAATAGDAVLNFGNGGTNYIFSGNASNVMAFAVNGSERMRINASGDLGIGLVPSGTYKLEVNGNLKAQGNFVLSSSTGSKIYPYFGTATNNNYITAGSGGELKFGTGTSAPADRVVISAAGDAYFTAATSPENALSIGYRGVPRAANITTSRTLVLTDSGQFVRFSGSTAGQSVTVPANSSVAFLIGTAVTIINRGTVSITVPITTDTLYLAGTDTTGTRTLAPGAQATLLKTDTTEWSIGGAGVS